MRILLDESLPKRLKDKFPGHEVWTVAQMSWSGKTNGELLTLASGRFDAFITIDRGIPYQQNLAALSLRIVVLQARSNAFGSLLPLIPAIIKRLTHMKPGEVSRIGTR